MSDTPQETQAPQTVAADIAAQLDESAPHVIGQIQRIVDHLGAEVAYGFLDKTKQCLAEGGVLTHDGKRKRTAGGTFFFLVRGGVTARLSGLHRPPAVATCKQWERVAETLAADDNDRLVVTGYPVLDKVTEAIVVLGQYVRLTSQQEQKRPSGEKQANQSKP